MAGMLNPISIVDAAAHAVQERYSVTITPEARAVLLAWASANEQRLADYLAKGWTDEQFIAAATRVLAAAAELTVNSQRSSSRALVETEQIARSTTVSAFATRKVLPDNCPFYGC
jgi:hypothetical protein